MIKIKVYSIKNFNEYSFNEYRWEYLSENLFLYYFNMGHSNWIFMKKDIDDNLELLLRAHKKFKDLTNL